MTKVVVVGAGIGGVPMAFELKEMLGKSADVQVVSESEWFQFVPRTRGSPLAGEPPIK